MKVTIPFGIFFCALEVVLYFFAPVPVWALCVMLGVTVLGLFVYPIIGTGIQKKGYNNGICPKCGKKLRLYRDWTDEEEWHCDNCGYKVKLDWWFPKR